MVRVGAHQGCLPACVLCWGASHAQEPQPPKAFLAVPCPASPALALTPAPAPAPRAGGTLIECQKLLATQGAAHVSAYATHGVFPNESWRRFEGEGTNGAADGFKSVGRGAEGAGGRAAAPRPRRACACMCRACPTQRCGEDPTVQCMLDYRLLV